MSDPRPDLQRLLADIRDEAALLHTLREQLRRVPGSRQLLEMKLVEREASLQTADETLRRWRRPAPQPYGVSAEGAELLSRDWMRWLGIEDAEVTRRGRDGGIDVSSERYVAQTKHYVASLSVEPVREIAGIAAAEGKSAMFFTSGRYTDEALRFAFRAGVAAYWYRVEDSTLIPRSRAAAELMREVAPDHYAWQGAHEYQLVAKSLVSRGLVEADEAELT